jgi:hypothetical protein
MNPTVATVRHKPLVSIDDQRCRIVEGLSPLPAIVRSEDGATTLKRYGCANHEFPLAECGRVKDQVRDRQLIGPEIERAGDEPSGRSP